MITLLQAAAEDLQDRFERLEAQAAVLIQQKHVRAALSSPWACSWSSPPWNAPTSLACTTSKYRRMPQTPPGLSYVQAAAVAQWARLAHSQRYRSAVKQLRDGLQADLLEARAQCQTQARRLLPCFTNCCSQQGTGCASI